MEVETKNGQSPEADHVPRTFHSLEEAMSWLKAGAVEPSRPVKQEH